MCCMDLSFLDGGDGPRRGETAARATAHGGGAAAQRTAGRAVDVSAEPPTLTPTKSSPQPTRTPRFCGRFVLRRVPAAGGKPRSHTRACTFLESRNPTQSRCLAGNSLRCHQKGGGHEVVIRCTIVCPMPSPRSTGDLNTNATTMPSPRSTGDLNTNATTTAPLNLLLATRGPAAAAGPGKIQSTPAPPQPPPASDPPAPAPRPWGGPRCHQTIPRGRVAAMAGEKRMEITTMEKCHQKAAGSALKADHIPLGGRRRGLTVEPEALRGAGKTSLSQSRRRPWLWASGWALHSTVPSLPLQL